MPKKIPIPVQMLRACIQDQQHRPITTKSPDETSVLSDAPNEVTILSEQSENERKPSIWDGIHQLQQLSPEIFQEKKEPGAAMSSNPVTWSAAFVARWVLNNGGSQRTASVVIEDIDGRVLMLISIEQIANVLKIERTGERLRIEEALRSLHFEIEAAPPSYTQ